MAHLTVTETSGRIETHTRGRVFRKIHNKSTSGRQASKEKRRICVLSSRDGHALEVWNQNQACFGSSCRHLHYTREAVVNLIKAGTMRWVGDGKNVAAFSATKALMPKASGGMACMQLIDGTDARRGPSQHCSTLPDQSNAAPGFMLKVIGGELISRQ
jgi:hypothetical protein